MSESNAENDGPSLPAGPEDMQLSFELLGKKKDSHELQIYANEPGLRNLIDYLEGILERHDHEHLMTPQWGGEGGGFTELSGKLCNKKCVLINLVTITYYHDGHYG